MSKNDDWRTCEHCGCKTNAKVRACCERGRDDDKKAQAPKEKVTP